MGTALDYAPRQFWYTRHRRLLTLLPLGIVLVSVVLMLLYRIYPGYTARLNYLNLQTQCLDYSLPPETMTSQHLWTPAYRVRAEGTKGPPSLEGKAPTDVTDPPCRESSVRAANTIGPPVPFPSGTPRVIVLLHRIASPAG